MMRQSTSRFILKISPKIGEGHLTFAISSNLGDWAAQSAFKSFYKTSQYLKCVSGGRKLYRPTNTFIVPIYIPETFHNDLAVYFENTYS